MSRPFQLPHHCFTVTQSSERRGGDDTGQAELVRMIARPSYQELHRHLDRRPIFKCFLGLQIQWYRRYALSLHTYGSILYI